jgi:hypothetical protein
MAKTEAWGEPEPRDPRNASHLGTRVVEERRLAAWIGKSLVVQGKVISNQDLTIDGQVEGDIKAAHLQMSEGAMILGLDASGKKAAAGNREQQVSRTRHHEDQEEPVSVHS